MHHRNPHSIGSSTLCKFVLQNTLLGPRCLSEGVRGNCQLHYGYSQCLGSSTLYNRVLKKTVQGSSCL